jgi:hypothetical protein
MFILEVFRELTEIINTAPRFNALGAAEARVAARSVAVLFGTADHKKYGLEFGVEIVPATITTLASLLGKVVSSLPPAERPDPVVLTTEAMTLAMNEKAEVALVLALQGGGELTLAMPSDSLPVLRDQILEAIEASSRDRRT